MPGYGILKNGKLHTSSRKLEGYKPLQYEEIPKFDQSTHYVIQTDPVDRDSHIFIGVQIRKLEIVESEDLDFI